MKINQSIFKTLIACTLLLLMIVMLSSCSFNKDDAELTLLKTEFEYYEETNITLVKCDIKIKNDTIYNINSFDLEIGVYSNGECISSESKKYDCRIKHDEEKSVSVSFTVDGEADYAALTTWAPNYEPFWKIIFNIF